MSTTAPERPQSPATPLRAAVAEEVRALLGRRRMTAIELARRIGKSHTYVGRRLNGETAFDLDDLERIAVILSVSVTDLLPGRAPDRPTDPDGYTDGRHDERHTSPYSTPGARPSSRQDQARPASHRPPSGPGRTSRLPRPIGA